MNKEYGEDRKWSPFEEFIEDMKSKSKPAKINAILYISRCPPCAFMFILYRDGGKGGDSSVVNPGGMGGWFTPRPKD